MGPVSDLGNRIRRVRRGRGLSQSRLPVWWVVPSRVVSGRAWGPDHRQPVGVHHSPLPSKSFVAGDVPDDLGGQQLAHGDLAHRVLAGGIRPRCLVDQRSGGRHPGWPCRRTCAGSPGACPAAGRKCAVRGVLIGLVEGVLPVARQPAAPISRSAYSSHMTWANLLSRPGTWSVPTPPRVRHDFLVDERPDRCP